MDKAELEELVRAELGWMEEVCREAAEGRPYWRDLLQGALVEFVARIDEWCRQEALESRRAQVRTFFRYCLRHRLKEEHKRQSREELLGGDEGEEGDDQGDAVDRLTDTKPLPWDDRRELPRMVALLRQIESKSRALAALALHAVLELLKSDVAAGATVIFRGLPWVRRDVDDCWDLMVTARERPDLVLDETEWKRTLARVLRFPGPPSEMPAKDLYDQVNVIEKTAARAIDDVRKLLAAEGAA